MAIAPSLFISHGAPTLALAPGKLGRQLATLGAQLEPLRAILVISPHWQANDWRLSANPAPQTLHDFAGFPRELYRLQYPAAGEPALAAELAQALQAGGLMVSLDAERGLDHGAWVPLMHLRPQADIPVLQLAMPYRLTASEAFQMGQQLASWRRAGVMLLASGSLTHNLFELAPIDSAPARYVPEFSGWVREQLQTGNTRALLDWRRQAPHAARAHPSEEHFLPLLMAMGARFADESPCVIADEILYGVLSMESYAWGLSPRH